MSATKQQSSREGEQSSSDGQQGRAESDDEQRPDEQEQKEQKEEQEEEQGPKRPDLWKKFAGALPLIFGLGFCVAFFVWVCMQMAGQTVGGPPLLLGIFGGSILGILVAGAGMGLAKLADKK
jgi:hypothetical protein